MSTQPEALRLADELKTKGDALGCSFDRHSAELRRLYAENRLLHERHAGDNEILHGLEQQRDELLAALELIANTGMDARQCMLTARAAIAKVEAGK